MPLSSLVHTDIKTIPSAGEARGSPVPTLFHDDPYMLVIQAYSSTGIDTEFEPFKDPIEIEEPHSLSPRSAPSSLDYTLDTPHIDEESESSETSYTTVTSPHSTTSPLDPTLLPSPQQPPLTQTSPISQHRVTEVMAISPPLISNTKTEYEESEAEGTDSESEESTFEDQQQQAILAEDTLEDEPSGLGYRAARCLTLELAEGTVPSTYEIG
ncbi:hypothetical protein Tco_0957590 [Tanacetum coccineum]